MELASKYKIIEFKEISDSKGKLVAIEGLKDIPFEIKRIFYIYGVDRKSIRGQHANKKSEFILINLCGSCKVRLYDNNEEAIINLDKPYLGLYISKLVWKDMFDFSDNSILLSLSNEYYDKNEYIKKEDIK